jgi:paired amphipathic helix protein Sin3a
MKPEDAMEFLECIRDRFADMPFIYNTFLAVMRDFKSQSISTQDVIHRVKQLFEGHPDLIDGFNMFLPPAYRLQVDWSDTEGRYRKAQQFSTSYEPAQALTNHH